MADIVSDPQVPVAPRPAQAVTHVDALRPGTRLAEFEVQGLLGVGGFGLVYRAYDHSLHRTVAIKEYMPAALAARLDGVSVAVRSSAEQATYRSGLDSFVAEARLLARFDHPSLVKVYRFWEANNTAYMVMPLYSGMTLSQARSQMAAPPPEAWLRTVLWSILQALHVLHQNDTLHRDISPDNIFLQDMGPPVLLDLGAARRAINDKPHKLTAVLKVNYAPIEQYAEAEELTQGPWTDLYALAAVVYSCLRNAPPLPATARVVRDSMPSVRSVAATVKEHFGTAYSDQFVRAITHALAVQPGDRPQSLAAFVTEMKLKAPPRLSKFDWRRELGVALKSDQDENSSRQFWNTQPQTVPDPTRQAASGRSGRGAQGGRRLTAALGRHAKPVALGLLALLIGAGGLLWLLPADDGGSLWGTAPVVATPDPAAMPAPAALPAASEPQAASPLATDAAPAVVPAPAPIVKPPAVERRSASPAVKTPRVQPPPAEDEARKPAARAPARPVNPEPAPKPQGPSEGARAAPRELCANANFFTRPMCIYEECQKPANAQLPICIENRKQYPNGPNASPAF
jgi:non-specific serine/threonine protein kinase